MKIQIQPQPDDETCWPTSLHAVYLYYQDAILFDQVIDGVTRIKMEGTLASYLGVHALTRGYEVASYIYTSSV